MRCAGLGVRGELREHERALVALLRAALAHVVQITVIGSNRVAHAGERVSHRQLRFPRGGERGVVVAHKRWQLHEKKGRRVRTPRLPPGGHHCGEETDVLFVGVVFHVVFALFGAG
jgi:hypothetical protein